MSKLNGQQFEQLQQALESAFPDYDDLARMVRIKLEKDLEHIVKRDALSKVVFQLIKTAEAQGWMEELIRGARAAVPGNEKLRAFAEAYAAYQKALELYNLAVKNPSLARWEQAIQSLHKALKLNPDDREAKNKLAEAERQQHLAQLYAEALIGEQSTDWERVIDYLYQIIDDTPTYRDAQQRITKAKDRLGIQARQSSRIERRIDAAVPSSVELNKTIDLLVQVRFPASPQLGIADWPTRTKPDAIAQAADNVRLEFPVDPNTGVVVPPRLRIEINTPDFEVQGPNSQIIEVPQDDYSRRVSFLLKAKMLGQARIDVLVYRLDQTVIGQVPLETTIDTSALQVSSMRVAKMFLVVEVGNPAYTAVSTPGMKRSEQDIRDDLKREHDLLQKRLQLLHALEIKEAQFGINTPAHITIEANDLRERLIPQHKKRIASLEDDLNKLTTPPSDRPQPEPSKSLTPVSEPPVPPRPLQRLSKNWLITVALALVGVIVGIVISFLGTRNNTTPTPIVETTPLPIATDASSQATPTQAENTPPPVETTP
ncbi:MAG: effector-associated domain EAD1-containing protein, partial [Chloroflexales bacterium]|nr:effector-associated domain EAD1-containing protein [Chloroflexales bacterium]